MRGQQNRVDLLYANATYPFYKNKMGKRSFFLSYKKKKKKRRFSSSEIVPLFSKTMDERTKNLSYFVCSSTKNMRTVWLHSILFLQVKSIESSLDDSTKGSVAKFSKKWLQTFNFTIFQLFSYNLTDRLAI